MKWNTMGWNVVKHSRESGKCHKYQSIYQQGNGTVGECYINMVWVTKDM